MAAVNADEWEALDHFIIWVVFMEVDLIIVEMLKVLLLATKLMLRILVGAIMLNLLAKMAMQVPPNALERSIYFIIIIILLMALISKYPAITTQILIEAFHPGIINKLTIIVNRILI